MTEKRNNGEREPRLERKLDLLVRRLKAADRTAATELVDIYYQRIFWFFRRMGHGRQESEDLTQETFLHAWRRISQLRDAKALNSWLYCIAANLSKLQWRKSKTRPVLSSEGQGINVPDNSKQPDKIGNDEQLSRINKVLGKMSIKQRQTVVLHYMQNLTITEAAKAAGIREGTFKSRLNRALKELRKALTSN